MIAANRRFCFGVGFGFPGLRFPHRDRHDLLRLARTEARTNPRIWGLARLQQMIGISRTNDVVIGSRRVPRKQAYDQDMATELVADVELEAATEKLADELRGFSPIAQRTAKKLLNDSEDALLSIAIELKGHCYSRLRTSNDFREGVEAFHGKRKPKFIGPCPASCPADRQATLAVGASAGHDRSGVQSSPAPLLGHHERRP